MPEVFSIIIHPPTPVLENMRQVEMSLKRQIGWFHSVNSPAHLTVTGFIAKSWQLREAMRFVTNFRDRRASLTVLFNRFKSYDYGAFFLAPDARSCAMFSPVMKAFNRKFLVRTHGATDPHMTIARGLSIPEVTCIHEVFASVSPVIFLCG